MAKEYIEQEFETHHDQLIDTTDTEPVTVTAEILQDPCKPPQLHPIDPANFPMSQSEYERLTDTKRQTTAARIKQIEGALGRLGSCLDDQKRITEQGHLWLLEYTAADDKTQYLAGLKSERQAQAAAAGSSLAKVSAATSKHSEIIAQRESQLTDWMERTQAAAIEAQEAFLLLCQGEEKAAEFAQMEAQALEAELMSEAIAELAEEQLQRQIRKSELKAQLREKIAAVK